MLYYIIALLRGIIFIIVRFCASKNSQKRFCWRHHVALKEKLSPPLEHQPLKKEQLESAFSHIFSCGGSAIEFLKLYSIFSIRKTSVDAVFSLISKITFLCVNKKLAFVQLDSILQNSCVNALHHYLFL